MKWSNNKFSIIGIIVSVLCIIAVVIINYIMSVEYHEVDRATQARFGVQHIERYVIGGIGYFISLACFVIGILQKEKMVYIIVAIILSLILMLLTFTFQIWWWMV